MVFQVRKLFLCKHRFTNPRWSYLGSQRYEISEMNRFFRSDNSKEQVENSDLLFLAGDYKKIVDKMMPIIVVPDQRNDPAGRIEIIGITRGEDYEWQVYDYVRRYAETLARKKKLDFCDLTLGELEAKIL